MLFVRAEYASVGTKRPDKSEMSYFYLSIKYIQERHLAGILTTLSSPFQ